MAGQWGGYRKPTNPAPVSGPGANSARTDGGPAKMNLSDAAYGEQKAFQEIQSGAPLSAPQAATAGGGLGDLVAGLTGLGAPTGQPGVPVTDGAALGPGRGLSAIGGPPTDLRKADALSLSRHLPVLLEMAASENTPAGFRNFVRMVFAYSQE